MASILVVDDQKVQRKNLAFYLKSQGYEIEGAESAEEALTKIEAGCFDIVITDFKLGKMTGYDLMLRARQIQPFIEFVIMTAFGTIPLAVNFMRDGAADFISKPFEFSTMQDALERVLGKRKSHAPDRKIDPLLMVANSQKMKDIVDLAAKGAVSEVSILIEGETGTGKELFARVVHSQSRRGRSEFVICECAGVGETELENDLFGRADQLDSGLVARADGGTLFFRDVHALGARLQARLLRILREGVYASSDSASVMKSDIRVIASSVKPLKTLVSTGAFREDLYYTLAVMPVHMPALRDRIPDIMPLVKHFLMKYRIKNGKNLKGVAPEVLSWMNGYEWPGNVQELENIVARACALASGEIIDESLIFTLPQDRPETSDEPGYLNVTLKDNQRSLILKALRQNNGNYSRTASQLGISRTTLWRRLKRFKIEGLPVENEPTA